MNVISLMNLESAGEIKTKNMVFRCSKHVHDVSGYPVYQKVLLQSNTIKKREESRTVERNKEFQE